MAMKKRILISVSFFILLLFSGVVFASPEIDFAAGQLVDTQSVIISGTGFGFSGPNIVIFDDLNRGTAGKEIDLSATVGSWSGVNSSPEYVSDGNNTAAALVVGTSLNQLYIDFVATQEVFISYDVLVPAGYHFPNTKSNGDFAPDSAWKMVWLFDDSTYDGYRGDDDIIIPTWGNGTDFSIGGNDNAFPATKENGWITTSVGRPGKDTNWFSFDGWNRISTYLKGGADPINDNGTIWFSGISEEFGQKQFSYTDRPIFDGDDNSYDNAISQWTHINFPGWFRTEGVNSAYDSTTRGYYDNIYVAIGKNAAARVELGNNITYANCTKLAIVTPTSWSDTSITATIREGDFSTGDSVYIFVIDKDNTPSQGFGPFKVGESMLIPPHLK